VIRTARAVVSVALTESPTLGKKRGERRASRLSGTADMCTYVRISSLTFRARRDGVRPESQTCTARRLLRDHLDRREGMPQCRLRTLGAIGGT
jgi:hypothetical protein